MFFFVTLNMLSSAHLFKRDLAFGFSVRSDISCHGVNKIWEPPLNRSGTIYSKTLILLHDCGHSLNKKVLTAVAINEFFLQNNLENLFKTDKIEEQPTMIYKGKGICQSKVLHA